LIKSVVPAGWLPPPPTVPPCGGFADTVIVYRVGSGIRFATSVRSEFIVTESDGDVEITAPFSVHESNR